MKHVFGFVVVSTFVLANDRERKVTLARIPCDASEAEETAREFLAGNPWIPKPRVWATFVPNPMPIDV